MSRSSVSGVRIYSSGWPNLSWSNAQRQSKMSELDFYLKSRYVENQFWRDIFCNFYYSRLHWCSMYCLHWTLIYGSIAYGTVSTKSIKTSNTTWEERGIFSELAMIFNSFSWWRFERAFERRHQRRWQSGTLSWSRWRQSIARMTRWYRIVLEILTRLTHFSFVRCIVLSIGLIQLGFIIWDFLCRCIAEGVLW